MTIYEAYIGVWVDTYWSDLYMTEKAARTALYCQIRKYRKEFDEMVELLDHEPYTKSWGKAHKWGIRTRQVNE